MDDIDDDTVEATLSSTLDTLDAAVNYLAWIVDLAAPYLDGRILEVGAGHGTFTESLAAFGEVDAVEPSDLGAATIQSRFADDPRISTCKGVVGDLPNRAVYGSAVMVNVLEHIDDDHRALVEIRDRLLPGGHLVVWVPAFNALFSDFDRDLGHHRRYRRRQLTRLCEATGFRVVDSRYVNLVGWFSWLVIARLLKRRPTSGRLVEIFDRLMVPPIRAIESMVVPPFGQSVLVVLRKPFDPAPTASDAVLGTPTIKPR